MMSTTRSKEKSEVLSHSNTLRKKAQCEFLSYFASFAWIAARSGAWLLQPWYVAGLPASLSIFFFHFVCLLLLFFSSYEDCI